MLGVMGCLRRILVTTQSVDRKLLSAATGVSTSLSDSQISNTQSNEPDKLYRSLNVELRGNDPAVLKSYSWFASAAAKELGIRVGECWAPRKAHHQRWTLLKSVHIYKKHRVQYEVRTYFRHMEFFQLTGSTAETFLEYIERMLPEGVALKATKHEIQRLPEHLVPVKKEIIEESVAPVEEEVMEKNVAS